MIYREYMEQEDNRNFSWCHPYEDSTGEYKMVIYDGEVSMLVSPKVYAQRYNGTLTDEVMEEFARAVNPFYDNYHGWSDMHIALGGMREIGCVHCPYFDECEAMGEEMHEEDYV